MTDVRFCGSVDSTPVLSFDEHHLKYRGEGNGSIVVAIGDTGKVLRLMKVTDGDEHCVTSNKSAQSRLMNDELHWLLRFASDTVRSLVGRRFIQPGELVVARAADLSRLNCELQSVRPDYRKQKNVAEVDSYALLMPDLCSSWTLKQVAPNVDLFGPILTIEIKPKTGFIMKSTKSGSGIEVPNVCKYQLMQKWKHQNNRISVLSNYCPLDLFSGCSLQMERAIRDLLHNPQNNIRIFLNGKLVYGDGVNMDVVDAVKPFFSNESSIFNELCNLIKESLLRNHPLEDVELSNMPLEAERKICECKQFTNSSDLTSYHSCGERLPDGCILNRILRMQMLCDCDARTIFPLYNQWRTKLEQIPFETLYEIIYSTPLKQSEFLEGTFEWAVQKIGLYLLSCTAKDCSIMLTVSNCSDTENNERNPWKICRLNSDGNIENVYVHSTTMVDVDWKSHDRISLHAKLEDNLIQMMANSN